MKPRSPITCLTACAGAPERTQNNRGKIPDGPRHTMLSAFLILAFMVLALWEFPGFAEERNSLGHFESLLSAKGFRAKGKIKDRQQVVVDRKGYTVILWVNPGSENATLLVRQIKFSVSRCVFSKEPPSDFMAQGAAELKVVYPAITGEEIPDALLSDFRLDLKGAKFYTVRGFGKVRLSRLPLYCDSQGGDNLELDFFPN